MSVMYSYTVFVGRFQPYHIGHHHVIRQALNMSGDVILVLGSHDKPRDIDNPFTTKERIAIIKSCFSSADLKRIHFAPQYDHPYNEEKWIAGVQASVNTIVHSRYTPDSVKIGIIGYNKDHSSYYLKKFPTWDLIEVAPYTNHGEVLNATEFRTGIFLRKDYNAKYFIDGNHANIIGIYSKQIHDLISGEMQTIVNYKKQWANSPYPPVFMTVDSVVTQSGHILLVKRKAAPGEGLWALPGGFINQHETLLESVVRELKEETKIDVPVPVLIGSIAKQHTFDAPKRSTRGRTITEAYHFKLSDMNKLPKVKGGDDAIDAKWFTLNEFAGMRNQMFEDHFAIVEFLLGL